MYSDQDGPTAHWPAGFTPESADHHFGADIVVHAPPQVVFDCLTDFDGWPSWVPGVSEPVVVAARGGARGVHTTFVFRLFGVTLECLLGEWLPWTHLGWSGLGPGLNFYHAWTFAARPGATAVTTEQAARGPAAMTMRDACPEWENFLRHGWLEALKRRAELE